MLTDFAKRMTQVMTGDSPTAEGAIDGAADMVFAAASVKGAMDVTQLIARGMHIPPHPPSVAGGEYVSAAAYFTPEIQPARTPVLVQQQGLGQNMRGMS